MRSNLLMRGIAAGLLAMGLNAAVAAPAAPVKRAVELPPSADLAYELSAQQRGIGLKGDALITWRAGDGRYDVDVEARVALLGKLNEYRSQGTVDAYGLAPETFTEKRYRKDPTTTTFDRESKTIMLTEAKQPYAMKGGEQDRASVTWQLAAVARAAGEAKFKPGSEWTFVVTGRRDAEPWTFRVVKQEKIRTAMGELDTIHVKRERRDSRGDSVEIWLAPSQEWYPVKLRFEDERDTIDQTITRITPK